MKSKDDFKIDGHNLVRDRHSKGLRCTDKEELQKYKQRVTLAQTVKRQNDDIKKLKDDMSEIKLLLKEILNNGTRT
jgi:hypothetical protein